MATKINVDQLLDDLEASISDFSWSEPQIQRVPRPESRSQSRSSGGPCLDAADRYPSLFPKYMQSPQAQGFHSVESPMHHANGQPSVRSNRSAEAEEEVRTLREQLDRAKLELERQAYMNNLLMYQQRIQSDIYSTASTTRAPPAPSSLKSVAPSDSTSVAMNRSRFYPSGIPSFASGATSASDSGSCVSRRSKTKSSTGWSGRSSQRFPGKIADAIIDDACNIELHSMVPVDAVLRAVSLVKEFYSEKTNKGAGASQAIMAIMYVCNLDDPAYVRRSMEVLDIVYKYGGPIFALNLALNLDFYQHFLETRKHKTQDEKDNIKYLCGLFAGWYLLETSFEDLVAAGNMKDPTGRVKEFFEGLVRAGYEFPLGSLQHIPAEKMAGITAWSLKRRGFSFANVKK